MFNHRFDQNTNNTVVFQWFLLSLNGGFINAGGFLATGRFVSHVTGFATLFGVDLANNQIEAALGIVSVPLFFLAGSFIAGLLIERPIHRHMKPHVDWVMGLSGICLLAASSAGMLHYFGQFGEEIELRESYLLLVLLCLASGLQNAAITSSSRGTVRTTHLTGLTTDLGLGLARTFAFDLKGDRLSIEKRANILRIGSIISFIIGSVAGAWVFLKFGYQGFILPSMIAFYASWHGRKANFS